MMPTDPYYQVPMLPTRYKLAYVKIDEIFKNNFPDRDENAKVNLFIDIKGCMPKLFDAEGMREIVKMYTQSNDKFIYARSVISLLNHWARYFRGRKIDFSITIFSEAGESAYHSKLLRTYKSGRKISKLKVSNFDTNLIDTSAQIIDYNIKVLESVINTLPDCYYINLEYLEADFVPHYIKQKYSLNTEKELSVILSSDKDLLQTLDYYTVQIAKRKDYEVYNPSNCIDGLGTSKFKNFSIQRIRTPKSIPLLLSIIGDKEDGVPGVAGLGLVKAYNYLNKLQVEGVIDGSFDWTAERLIFLIKQMNLSDNISKKLLESKDEFLRDFKLVSFDELIKEMSLQKKIQISTMIEKTDVTLHENVNPLSINATLQQICLYANNYSSLLK